MPSFLFVLLAVSFSVLSVHSCSKTLDDFDPIITDIFLNNADSSLLTVQIEGDKITNCRELNTGTKSLEFISISCDTSSYSWVDLSLSSTYADVHSSNDSNKLTIEFLESNVELELNVEHDIDTQYAWFYSSNEDALFIITVDANASAENMSETEISTDDLMVIFIAFNPNQNTSETKEYVVGTLLWTQVFNVEDNLVGSKESWTVSFDSTQMPIYDGLHMFQLPAVVDGCSGSPWFMYEVNGNLYDSISNGSSGWEYTFKYIGDGYYGVDDRIERAYGYSDYDVWWFSLDGGEMYSSISFSNGELTNWWILMWIVVGVLLCCVCISCCICCIRKKKKKVVEKRSHFHASVAV